MEPVRETFWGISRGEQLLLYGLAALACAWLARGVARRVSRWGVGHPAVPLREFGRRLRLLVTHALVQRRIVRQPVAGVMHHLLAAGFVVLFIGTTLVAIDYDTPWQFLRGRFYLVFEVVLDLFGLGLVAGLLLALARRQAPAYVGRRAPADRRLLVLLLTIAVTGFLVEAVRLHVRQPPWAPFSPVGFVLARALAGLPVGAEAWERLYTGIWWLHAVVVLGFLAALPGTKMFHLLASTLNIFFRTLEPMGALRPVDPEAEEVGAGTGSALTWKQRLDLDACTACGRCDAVCPALAVRTPLAPMGLVQQLKAQVLDAGDAVSPLVGRAVSAEEIWACTTCGACMEQCPVLIEHVGTIVDVRRHLIAEGVVPASAQLALNRAMSQGNPLGLPRAERAAWEARAGLGLPKAQVGAPPPLLFWVGCAGAYDHRNQRTVTALARLLQAAGVEFATLGAEERCTGDFARRLGEEGLFQMLAQENIATLARYGVRRIVTACPHCYNTLQHEYRRFGGDYEVLDHARFLADLVAAGRLRPAEPLPRDVTFHDPCYLGRYNGIVEEPRRLLRRIEGLRLREMAPCRERSFCCGAGGGHMWMEIKGREGRRINHERLAHALAVHPEVVATACPFCTTMFEDAAKVRGMEGRPAVMDVAEMLEAAGAARRAPRP
ncbi:MAG: 4Fe-4S dicluster domain-containing protein [Deltaproteobacteria bacterium]|nr:4Fe-4S dicluster domain-containing protein [Deltaproteobacteria bacterium]